MLLGIRSSEGVFDNLEVGKGKSATTLTPLAVVVEPQCLLQRDVAFIIGGTQRGVTNLS